MKSQDVAERLADALLVRVTHDPSLFAADATSWHNTDEVEQPVGGGDRVDAILQVIPDFRGREILIDAWENGFAIRYAWTGTCPDGSALRIPGCIIGSLRDGKIIRVQEYVDSAHALHLREALASAAGT